MLYFQKKSINNLLIYLLGGTLVSVLFSYFVSSLLLGVSVLLSFFLFDIKKFTKQKLLLWFAISLPFVLSLISVLFSYNFERGMDVVIKRLPIFLIPYTFILVNDIKKQHLINVFMAFSLGCALINIQGIVRGLLFFVETGLFFESNYLFHLFPIQHVYLSTYIVFILIASILFFRNFNKEYQAVLIAINFINLIGFIFLSSKMALIILIITITMVVLSKFNRKKSVWTLLLIFVFVFLAFFLFDPFLSRINSMLAGNDPRFVLWECSWSIIKSNYFFDFTPLGDFQEQLNSCYYNKTYKLSLEGFATHNQYLEFWITSGFIGFIGYILALIFLLRHAFLSKKVLLEYFILIIFLIGMTECIFGRQYGIMFYSTILGFLVFSKE